jgi:hypothetical protein
MNPCSLVGGRENKNNAVSPVDGSCMRHGAFRRIALLFKQIFGQRSLAPGRKMMAGMTDE